MTQTDCIKALRIKYDKLCATIAEKYRTQNHDDAMARKYEECHALDDDTLTTTSDLIDLLFSKQGREFTIKHLFPSIDDLRTIQACTPDAQELGWYNDAGRVIIKNKKRVFLSGNTNATIYCDSTDKYEIILRCGATVYVRASKYAVVIVHHDDTTSYTTTNEDGTAQIFL